MAGAIGTVGAVGAGAYMAVAGAGAGTGVAGMGAGVAAIGAGTGAGAGVAASGCTARSKQCLHYVFRHALVMNVDDLIGREVVRRPGVSDVGQDHFFTQAGLDQLDDILDSGREARCRLGRTIEGRHLQHQAGGQAGESGVEFQFNQTPASRYARRMQDHVSDTFHFYNLAHLLG